KRRFFAGWIHFRLLIRFDRLKKRFSLMLKGGLYRVPGGVSTQYGGLTKIKTVGHLSAVIPARAGVRTACSANGGAGCAPVR
ncbi:hypothetical protein O8D67_002022, partial [Neisseria gonorrhoeae]